MLRMVQVKQYRTLLNSNRIKEAHKIIRALGGITRFKIIVLLRTRKSGFTVTEMAEILNASLSRISHQLRILRRYRLVSTRKINREVIYTLADHRVQKSLPF